LNASALAERLSEAGLSSHQAERKAKLFLQARQGLESLGVREPAAARHLFVPGRVEVLGKHTDYAGGRSLLFAAERGFCFTASERGDGRIRVMDATDGTRVDLNLGADPATSEPSGWAVYPTTAAARLARNFAGARTGADIAFASDLPRAAGLSSSSALTVGVFTLIADANGIASHPAFTSAIRNRLELADYLGCLESGRSFPGLEGSEGTGALIGSEDQTGILCSRPSELLQSRFCPVQIERRLKIPREWTFLVGVSGVLSDKTGSVRDAYNRLSRSAGALADCWRGATGRNDASLFAAATSAPDAPQRMREILDASSRADFPRAVLRERFDQFFSETVEIIPPAAEAIARRQKKALGLLVDRSQALAEQLLQNQIPQTVALARSARALGAIAASAFGGGFGGSVWALVPASESTGFKSRWAAAYLRAFPDCVDRAVFFETRPGPALLRLDGEAGRPSISDLT
jgi:galactokinase